jgi:hypothetical protein
MVEQFGAVDDFAPMVADDVRSKGVVAVQFLQSKLPAQYQYNALVPGAEEPLVSDYEMNKFLRYVEAVQDPTATFDHLAAGTLSPEHVEVLQNVYPRIYAAITQETMSQLVDMQEKGDPMPYGGRIQLGTLLNIDSDPSLQGEYMASVQDMWVAEPEEFETPAQPTGKVNTSLRTEIVKIETGQYG